MERIDVLEDIGLAVGDEDHVELVQWLIHKSNIILFNCSMLGTGISQFGEGGKQSFDSRPLHFTELSREDSLASPGAD